VNIFLYLVGSLVFEKKYYYIRLVRELLVAMVVFSTLCLCKIIYFRTFNL